jgi:hypothetical protein
VERDGRMSSLASDHGLWGPVTTVQPVVPRVLIHDLRRETHDHWPGRRAGAAGAGRSESP